MNTPLISIIIPTYKRPKKLERALASIDAACSAPHEIIVVDDCPEKSAFDVAQKHQATYISKAELGAPRGPASSRNIGIQQSQARYLVFLDDDDFFSAGGLDALHRATLNGCTFAFGNFAQLGPDGSVAIKLAGVTEQHMLVVNRIPIGTFMMARSLVRQKFNEHMRTHEDWDFLLANIDWRSSQHVDAEITVIDNTETVDALGQERRSADRSLFALDFRTIYAKFPAPDLEQYRQQMLVSLQTAPPPSAMPAKPSHPVPSDMSTSPWAQAAAQQLATSCPALLLLPGLEALNPLQAWALWRHLQSLRPQPRVLEIGCGDWAAPLAVMTQALDGSFYSVGLEQDKAEILARRLQQANALRNLTISVTTLVATKLDGEAGQFPDLSDLGNEADFDLIWVHAARTFNNPTHATHSLPAVAQRLAPTSSFMLETESPSLQQRAASVWSPMASSGALVLEQDGLHGAGLLVGIGRADANMSDSTPATVRQAVSANPEPPANVIVTCYFNSIVDTQRGHRWPSTTEGLNTLGKSVEDFGLPLVVLHDCFSPETMDAAEFRVHEWSKVTPKDSSSSWNRWYVLRDYLNQHKEIAALWMVDSTDTELFRQPFGFMEPATLYAGHEPWNIAHMTGWAMNVNQAQDIRNWVLTHPELPMLNCGVVGGDWTAMMTLALGMISFREKHMQNGGSDNISFNMLMHTAYPFPFKHGRAITTNFKEFETREGSPSIWRHK